ncbi:MAG: transcriptional repressor [Clostridia bacterium]|nr:transcriptional repressor [Clostridia bacterium]
MANSKNYNTEGRAALLRFLSEHPDCQFSVDQLCLALNGDPERGKSSIYRRLSQLCEAQTVRKFRNEQTGCNVFQYVGRGCDCDNHFHEKCVRCGRIEHLDCHASADFFQHLLKEHGFEVYCGQSILYGLCAACRGKGDAAHA